MLSLPIVSVHRVRPARVGELRTLAAIRRHSWWDAYRGVLPEAELRRMDDRRTAQRMGDRPTGADPAVVGRGGRARRSAGLRLGGPHRERYGGHRGEIYELYLHPRAQGQGAGRQLLVAAIWSLVEPGLHPVLVWVLAANPARHFYAACGGVQVGQGPVTVSGRVLTRLAFSWRGALPLPF